MSVKNIQSLYKIMTQELANLDQSSLTPSKRNNKENMAKTVDALITTSKNHMYKTIALFFNLYSV